MNLDMAIIFTCLLVSKLLCFFCFFLFNFFYFLYLLLLSLMFYPVHSLGISHLFHLHFSYSAASKYCPLLIKEGGMTLLEKVLELESSHPDTKDMAR